MNKASVPEIPVRRGENSVLAGKDAIDGLPKRKDANAALQDPQNCESPLDGKQCIDGATAPKSSLRK